MTDIRPASDFSGADLCAAMNDAFSDYSVPMKLTEPGFAAMMRQRGLDAETSRVAVVGDELAAVWLVSVRGQSGYLISSGTRPGFRSGGLARALADDCLAAMKTMGVRTFQTEVIKGNEAATALYLRLGMAVSRHLDCYEIRQPVAADTPLSKPLQADWKQISPEVPSLRDWAPAWQNSDASLTAISDRLACVQIRDPDGLAAYAAVIPETATLAQIAVRADLRRRKLGALLVADLQRLVPDRTLRVLNAWADDAGFSGFMASLGGVRTVGQLELSMTL